MLSVVLYTYIIYSIFHSIILMVIVSTIRNSNMYSLSKVLVIFINYTCDQMFTYLYVIFPCLFVQHFQDTTFCFHIPVLYTLLMIKFTFFQYFKYIIPLYSLTIKPVSYIITKISLVIMLKIIENEAKFAQISKIPDNVR